MQVEQTGGGISGQVYKCTLNMLTAGRQDTVKGTKISRQPRR